MPEQRVSRSRLPVEMKNLSGALLATALWIPALVAIATVVPYLLLPDPVAGVQFIEGRGFRSLLIGMFAALVLWLLAGLVGSSYARADRASPASFAEIVERLDDLRARLEVIDRGPTANAVPGANPSTLGPGALMIVSEQIAGLTALLGIGDYSQGGGGTSWVRGTGYIEAWRRLHRAEEAMLLIEPIARVVATALDADLRLDGSSIAARDELRRRLAVATDALDPSFAKYRARGARADD